MIDIIKSLYNMRLLDELSHRETPVHRLHPLIKMLTTVMYLVAVASFDRYEIAGLIPFVFFPVIIFALGDIPVAPILKRVLLVEPLIIGIGILNPIFDQQMVSIGGIVISAGWITFLSIVIKCGLTVTTSMLLIATTGMDKLGAALRMLKIPKIFVLQLLLTYRYITVLIEEVSRMQRAYSLRSKDQKGIHISTWGSFAGQLILRTFERSQRVYQCMNLRGFSGEYNIGAVEKVKFKDIVYLAGWSLFFIIGRTFNIPELLGMLFLGVV